MPEDPFDPENRSPPREIDPADLHIPGAGNIAMAILLASLSVLFIASMLAFIIIRSRATQWPPAGFPPIPSTLWFSTLAILATSVTIQLAFHAIRNDHKKKLLLYLRITFALGLVFLILQSLNWFEFFRSLTPGTQFYGPYLGGFYTLTGLHAAHVLGGLIPLAIVTWRAKRGRYSRNFHPGIRYCTLYWHFLDIIWIVLFSVLYF